MKKVSDPPDDGFALALRKRSGDFRTSDPLVSFLYVLMRDWLTPGAVEYVMLQLAKEYQVYGPVPTPLTNGHLAEYAQDVADRLRKPAKKRRPKWAVRVHIDPSAPPEVRPAVAKVNRTRRV